MMEKNFLDVFPDLEAGRELSALLEEVVVTKVAVNPEKDHIRIYIRSRQWIHKKYIYSLEETIRNQFFPGVPMSVKIIEKFTLTGQYTPKLFFDAYRTSMSMELKNYSILVYNMFRTAQISFPEEQKMELRMQSSVLAKSREEELVSYIEKVFCERCPFSLIVEPEYVEASESKVRKNSEIRIMQEAAHVIEQSSFGQQQEEPDQFLEEGAGTASEALKEEEKKDASAGKAPAEEKKSPKGQKEEKGKDGKGRKSFGKGERSFGDYKRSIKRSDNPDVLYGRDFDDETIPLESVQTEMGEVCIRGQIMTLETREIRNEKTIIIFAVTDFTDSITVKMFARNDQVEEILAGVKEKAFLKLKGVTTIDRYDSELTIGSVVGIKKIAPFTSSRADTSPEKRVELHCHTKMSDMDGVSDAKAIIKRAYEWGHRAIAITDHGVVQAFPEANHRVADKFAELVKEASDGNVTIDVYPNDQLAGGNSTKGIEMIAGGGVDLAAYATCVMAVIDEQLSVATIPWIFDDYKHAREVIDGTGGEYYAERLEAKGITYLGSFHNGFRQITNSKREVRTPDDVKRLKIRVPGSEVYMKFFKTLGADPVAMSWSEVFTAIQQGTIDGQENGICITESAKMDEIQDYLTLWNYTYENDLFVANTEIWESLEPKTRELLQEKAKEACEWGRDTVEEEEAAIVEEFKSEGMTVTELTEEELDAFKNKISGVKQEFIEKYGEKACKAFGIESE